MNESRVRILQQISEFVGPAEEEWMQFLSTHPLASDTAPSCGRDAVACYQKLLPTGKHIRPFLFSLGHRLGPNQLSDTDQRLASGSIELLHNAFLIHDDIVDNSALRRGEDTVHVAYAKRAKNAGYPGPESEYGKSLALNIGDVGQALAQDFIFATSASPDLQLQAIRLLNLHLQNTVVGQLLDLQFTALKDLTEAQVLQIQTYKTAFYTFVLPLCMGCVLAGGEPNMIAVLEEYGRAVGIAFQIQDDYLGLFGDEKKVGKPVTSDITEGKKTLLMVNAYAKASLADREFMKLVHAHSDVSLDDLEKLRKIVRDSGALGASDKMASDCVEHAVGVLKPLESDGAASILETMRAVANYVIQRED
ncbi:MAG: polyprenyl synthetase family protein [Acidobacteria bacterium]|nr:MAG: polyprenyl synthetase family protein [Acidobacteriota bacterium]